MELRRRYCMKIGSRIIYDIVTGKVLNGTLDEREDSRMTEELHQQIRPINIDFIDLGFGALNNVKSFHVDVETRNIVIDEYFQEVKTVEQLKIEELENQILLMAENEVGGIL
jgi:hypothetical protein